MSRLQIEHVKTDIKNFVDGGDICEIQITFKNSSTLIHIWISELHKCCETFGIKIYKDCEEAANIVSAEDFAREITNKDLKEFVYDTAAEVGFRRKNKEYPYRDYDERELAFLKLVVCNIDGETGIEKEEQVYCIQVYNEHNGYYPHEWGATGPNDFNMKGRL